MVENPKRFEDWPTVDCDNCEEYWTNACDGVPQGSERPCNSFKATRAIVIPAKIKALEKAVQSLSVGLAFIGGYLLVYSLIQLFGG